VTNEEANRRARERGPSRLLYAVVRGLVVAFMRVWFRLSITGAEHIPAEGAAIVTPNHKSFWDSFFVGAATRRPLRFMGKSELFESGRGRLLVALGAFPVRRGTSDEDALETARVILRQGGLLSLFPEGTRVREPGELGEPRRGAARLALETGAPLVPAAITGTDHLFLGPLPKPKRVRLAFSPPIPVSELEPTPEVAASLLDDQLWPEVEGQFRSLLNRRTAAAAALAALGIGAGVAARRRRKPKRRFPWPR
jgi:1-acyl-sn-glycerol-3-phosphate acyltransferase